MQPKVEVEAGSTGRYVQIAEDSGETLKELAVVGSKNLLWLFTQSRWE
jgi:hypothetical protein